jgi:hypothetical protein
MVRVQRRPGTSCLDLRVATQAGLEAGRRAQGCTAAAARVAWFAIPAAIGLSRPDLRSWIYAAAVAVAVVQLYSCTAIVFAVQPCSRGGCGCCFFIRHTHEPKATAAKTMLGLHAASIAAAARADLAIDQQWHGMAAGQLHLCVCGSTVLHGSVLHDVASCFLFFHGRSEMTIAHVRVMYVCTTGIPPQGKPLSSERL